MDGRDAEGHAPDIAYHLYQAGGGAPGERTARWLVTAAVRALDALAFEDALRDLDAARTVLPERDAEGAIRVLRLRARALRGLARLDEALAAFAEALQLAPAGAERDAVLQARTRLKLDLFRGRDALADIEPLLVAARAAGDRVLDIWGGFGAATGQFDSPQGIAVFGDRVYVVDSGNDRVRAFSRSGDFLTQWGEPGVDAPSQFAAPRGIAVDRDGHLYVVDAGNDRVQKFTPDGAFVVSFGHTSPGRFINSIGVAVADNGDVLVVNSGEKRVVVWQTPQ